MPDWSKAMQQTFEYFLVDPGTWKDMRPVNTVLDSSINRDSGAETLGSLTINIGEPIGESYIRIYLITIQNGIREKHPLGTYLIQTPAFSFDGKMKTTTIEAYTPLLELKENQPPLGYALMENDPIMETAYRLVRENVRAPVARAENTEKLYYDFVADTSDTWVTFIRDLIANAKYSLMLDEMGRVLFQPIQDVVSLRPKWTFDSSNSSILHPKVDIRHDLYKVPNVVEVIYSNGKVYLYSRVENNDSNSPVSISKRGRKIVHREVNPNTLGNPTQAQLDKYATQMLKALSSLEYTVSFTHGYCPVNINDCIRLDYPEAGINNVRAKIVSQNISCVPGCPVTATAKYTNQLWGD